MSWFRKDGTLCPYLVMTYYSIGSNSSFTDQNIPVNLLGNSFPVGRRAQRERSAPSVEGGLLGVNASLVSVQEEKARGARILRFFLQSVAAQILVNERVVECLQAVVPGKEFVNILYAPKFKRAHFGNLITCASVWACPVCAVKITERRKEEFSPAIDLWQAERGDLISAAFTLQHDRATSLKSTKAMLASAFRKLQGGNKWIYLKKRLGIVGYIVGNESPWGAKNGWHPHKHVLYLTDRRLTPGELEATREEISDRFENYVSELGGFVHPDIGVHFDLVEPYQNKDYIFKWGAIEEITKGPVKKGKGNLLAPFQLLEWYGISRENLPLELFKEYFEVHKGCHQLDYSSKLRELLGLEKKEKSDSEVAAEQDEEAYILAQLARDAWRIVCQKGKRGELLEIASSGEFDRIFEYLEKLGFEKRKNHESDDERI